jgi:intracellular septation protein
MKFLFDLFPVLLFFVAFKIWDIYVATSVAIAATLIQVAYMWIRHRRVDGMLWFSLAIIMIFGGATLILHDETFIKWKPTVLYWFFTLALLGAQLFTGKNLIRTMLSSQIVLPEHVWKRLLFAWAGFFAVMGALNLYVAFNYSTDLWVKFKLFGGIGLMMLFALAQGVFLSRHMEQDERK